MEIVIGIVIVGVVIWILVLCSVGTARGQAIGNEFNATSEKIQSTRICLFARPPKLNRIGSLRTILATSSKELIEVTQIAHVVTSKLNQALGQTTKPLAEFVSEAAAEFSVAIGTSIVQRDPALVLQVMNKYGSK